MCLGGCPLTVLSIGEDACKLYQDYHSPTLTRLLASPVRTSYPGSSLPSSTGTNLTGIPWASFFCHRFLELICHSRHRSQHRAVKRGVGRNANVVLPFPLAHDPPTRRELAWLSHRGNHFYLSLGIPAVLEQPSGIRRVRRRHCQNSNPGF